jgi:hypothetical protein
MKYLLSVLLVCFCLSASAQWTVSGAKNRWAKGYGLARVDTATLTGAYDTSLVVEHLDGNIYWKNTGYWQPIVISTSTFKLKHNKGKD